MRHSIWKLTAIIGISGLGFLVILQVQKGLHSAGTAQAAEDDPNASGASKSGVKPAARRAAPGRVRMQLEPPVAAVGSGTEGGLDFRKAAPGPTQDTEAGLKRVADVELKPIPRRSSAGSEERLPLIVPAGHEEPADAPAGGQKSEDAAASPTSDYSEFGPDPFGDAPPGADSVRSAEPAGPAASPESVAPRALPGDDPFGDEPLKPIPAEDEPAAGETDAATAEPPALESPAAEAAAGDSPFAVSEGATVPIDSGPAKAPETAETVEDDPFGDLAPVEPTAAGADSETGSEPAAQEPAAEAPAVEAPAVAVPATLDPSAGAEEGEPAADPFGDPFGGLEQGGKEAAPVETAPEDLPTTSQEPEPAEPAVPAADGPPAEGATFPDAASEKAPSETLEEPSAAVPPAADPQQLPQETEEDMRGVGTLTPDSPRGPQRAELSVEKNAPERAVLGQPLVYEIVVTNVGESIAQDVTISDVIPKGTELQGTMPRAEMAGKMLVWRLESLEPSQSKSIKVKVLPVEAGPIGSVATVTFVSEVAAETEVISPNLTLKIDAPQQVALGEPVDLRFEITNGGTAPAEKVLLRELLPEGFQHTDGNDLEYEVGTLAPGGTESVTLRVATVKAGRFTNKAVITAAGGMKAEASASVEVAEGRVVVSRRGPRRRYVGRPAMYYNVVRNTSAEPVRGIRVIEQVPEGMEFVSASHGGQFDPGGRTIVWQIESLGPQQEQTLQVLLTAGSEGVQDSVVRVEEGTAPPIELASSTTVAGAPSLAPTLQGPGKPIIVGERAAFRIRVKNRGNAPASGVTVSLALPAELTFIEARGGGTAEAGPAGSTSVPLPAPIPAGGEQVIDFVVQGTAAGTAKFRAEVGASHLARPLTKQDQLTVLAPTP